MRWKQLLSNQRKLEFLWERWLHLYGSDLLKFPVGPDYPWRWGGCSAWGKGGTCWLCSEQEAGKKSDGRRSRGAGKKRQPPGPTARKALPCVPATCRRSCSSHYVVSVLGWKNFLHSESDQSTWLSFCYGWLGLCVSGFHLVRRSEKPFLTSKSMCFRTKMVRTRAGGHESELGGGPGSGIWGRLIPVPRGWLVNRAEDINNEEIDELLLIQGLFHCAMKYLLTNLVNFYLFFPHISGFTPPLTWGT